MDPGVFAFGFLFYVHFLHEVTNHPYSCHVRDCQDIKDLGFTTSGVYEIYPEGRYNSYDVYCDMDTDGGGWLVLQRRTDGSVDFNRTWDEYVVGFGDVSGEHWLGNQPIRSILSNGEYELRIEGITFAYPNVTITMSYGIFDIGDYAHNYKLSVGVAVGEFADVLLYHDGAEFSTNDKENNPSNCSSSHTGGWWFKDCRTVNINGLYVNDPITGITWKNKFDGLIYPLFYIEMKVRRA